MSSKRKLNLNINEIDVILNTYYNDKISVTQIGKNMKIASSKVKSVISDYSGAYLNKFPQYKPVDDVSVNEYEQYILSGSYTPSKLTIEKSKRQTRVLNDTHGKSKYTSNNILDDSPYLS